MIDGFIGDREITVSELEVRDLVKEVPVAEQRESLREPHIELSQDIQNLTSEELRKLASDEYAENGKTPLRDAYLKLAKEKSDSEQKEHVFGEGTCNGLTAKECLAKAKIAELKGSIADKRYWERNAERAAKNSY